MIEKLMLQHASMEIHMLPFFLYTRRGWRQAKVHPSLLPLQLHLDCPSAGGECRAWALASPAFSMLMLSHCSQHRHRVLNESWTPCSLANEINASPSASIPKIEIVVSGGGHHGCSRGVAGQSLSRSQSFTYHRRLHLRSPALAICACFSNACESVASVFSWFSLPWVL